MARERLRIGEVAAQSGVSIQTLRYYERRGLLRKPARRPSGYRDYSPDVVQHVRLIKWAQRLGFTLEEIKDLVPLFETRAHDRAAGLRKRARSKIGDIDEKIRDLERMRNSLQALAECSCNGRCPIIAAVLGESATARASNGG
ncbi:MAG TPA: MerR family transcriptional regulator [Blastocatellia bacterium]|nr:MerR family transcriptional regulator [Blastocatellia bacterium]